MVKFIGIITNSQQLFDEASKMLKHLLPAYTVIDSPVVTEAEADQINLQDGLVIRILPDHELETYPDVDSTIHPKNTEELYYLLESLSLTIYEQS